jgi:effector-binding domain-containing protein
MLIIHTENDIAMIMTEVRMQRTNEQPAITIRERINLSEVPQFMDEAYGELRAEKRRKGWRMVGTPFAYYHSRSDQEVDVECGFPVAWPIEGSGRIRAFTLPSVRAATAMHIGPYMNLMKTYEKVERWIREQGQTGRTNVGELPERSHRGPS